MTCEHEHEQSQYIIIFLKLREIGGWLMSSLGIPRFVILDNVMIWAFPICGWFLRAQSWAQKLCFTKTYNWIMCDCPGASTCIHSWLSFYLMYQRSVFTQFWTIPETPSITRHIRLHVSYKYVSFHKYYFKINICNSLPNDI